MLLSKKFQYYLIYFACHIKGQIRSQDNISRFASLPLEYLPVLSLAH